jgi:DNA repair protein SbcD/Mre11
MGILSVIYESFCTVEVDVSQAENPEKAILKAIEKKEIKDAVVRLIYKLSSDQLELINTNTLQDALKTAHTYTIRAELISQLARPRLPELGVGNSLDPLEALQTYLGNREDLKDIEGEMLDAAQGLLDPEESLSLF